MRNYFVYFIAILLALVGLASCHDDGVKSRVKIETVDSNVKVTTSLASLSNRIVLINEPIETTEPSYSSYKVKKTPPAPDYNWTLLAEMPVLNNLSASFIECTKRDMLLDGTDNYVYVSYNTQGDDFGGAFEVIDVSDPDAPFVSSQVIFDDIDINQLVIDPTSNKVWLAGSRNVDGAVIIELEVVDGIVASPPYTYVSLKGVFEEGISASANSICYTWDNPEIEDEFLMITCGNSIGGLVKLDATNLEYVDHIPFTSAKYVVTNHYPNLITDLITFSSGVNAKVRAHNIDELYVETLINLGTVDHQNVSPEYQYSGKNTMVLTEDRTIYIALGSRGVKAYDPETGILQHSSVSDMLTHGNSNGVNVDMGFNFVYMANGADGMAVAPIPDNPGDDIIPIFTWDTSEQPASANFITSGHYTPLPSSSIPEYSLIFLAKGLGGVKILKVTEIDD